MENTFASNQSVSFTKSSVKKSGNHSAAIIATALTSIAILGSLVAGISASSSHANAFNDTYTAVTTSVTKTK
ncbi:hypothetical protein [Secundilactobacillus kimchicus]|uniref:hypothetical protein n=1 Tax=Secundilactobacillus kimchicus TaxID=528209 RepID=UPI0024A9B356|nr:hypothetical protein [Secundilactobacillus kimchicus]